MTEDAPDDRNPSETPASYAGPFGAAITDQQRQLLRIIWEPALEASRTPDGAQWPTWDYVQLTALDELPELGDPWSALRAMPTSRHSIGGPEYGLWFARDSVAGQPPERPARMMLTIAGLAAVGGHYATEVASVLVSALHMVAIDELMLPRLPFAITGKQVSLDALLRESTLGTKQREIADQWKQTLPTTLAREFIGLHFSHEDVVHFGGASLRELVRVETLDEYLRMITDADQTPTPHMLARAELPLHSTLDYLAVTLQTHPGWTGEKLLHVADLQSAGGAFRDAHTPEDFQARLIELWAIIDRFRVPDPDGVEPTKTKPPSLSMLQAWLGPLLDRDARMRTDAAITQIRQIRKVRSAHAHPNSKQIADASAAFAALGIPQPTQDWNAAIQIVRARLADAFETIREEVALSVP